MWESFTLCYSNFEIEMNEVEMRLKEIEEQCDSSAKLYPLRDRPLIPSPLKWGGGVRRKCNLRVIRYRKIEDKNLQKRVRDLWTIPNESDCLH